MPRLNQNRRRQNQRRYVQPNQSGDGFSDIFKTLVSGRVATAIKNAIPSSDATARPQYPGELHGILKLKNGRSGIANYMGPGTRLVSRLRRGDPPRTRVDRVAQGHDIRYGLSENLTDIRKADNIMIKSIEKLAKDKTVPRRNINQARLIRVKKGAEDLGVLKKNAFSGDLKNKQPNASDKALMVSKLNELGGEGLELPSGQGLLPGDALKLKLLKRLARDKKKSTKVKIPSASFILKKTIPTILKALGVKPKKQTADMLKAVKASISKHKKSKLSIRIADLSKTLLPIIIQHSGQAGSGSKKKLLLELSKGLIKSFQGSGLSPSGGGESFWSGFKRGFHDFFKVFKPIAKAVGPLLTQAGVPELGVPLQIASVIP